MAQVTPIETKAKRKKRVEAIARKAYEKVLPVAFKRGWTKSHTGTWEEWPTEAQAQWIAAADAVLQVLEEEAR